jgi:hypothetical protein
MSRESSTRPSPLACGECRKRHLKCDAALPICARCSSNGLECTYVPSRRGGVPRAKRCASQEHEPRPKYYSPSTSFRSIENDGQATYRGQVVVQSTSSSSSNATNSNQLSTHTPDSGLPDSEEEHLTNLFYSNFYPAHPLLVTRAYYRRNAHPLYLRLVVCFIGSHYAVASSFRETLRESVARQLAGSKDRTATKVQALVLYAIVLHAQHQAKEAATCISDASKLAIDLGMNRPRFANDMAANAPQLEESYRRTWWELYIVDGYIAALSRNPSFRSNTVGIHPYLPCEEAIYARGICGQTLLSLGQFDDRVFVTQPYAFSSYSYRIDAIRILARVLSIAGANDACPDEVQAVDNALASFKYHL